MLYPVELRGRFALDRLPFACAFGTAEAAVASVTGKKLGWETGIEPATAGATVQCSAS